MTVYYVCDSCAHVTSWPDEVDEAPVECEHCRNWSLTGPFSELPFAEEISQLRLDAREEVER